MSSYHSPAAGASAGSSRHARRVAGFAVRAAALAVLALPLLAGCSSFDDSPVVRDLDAAESHNPPGHDALAGQDRGANGKPWGGCPDTYRGWC